MGKEIPESSPSELPGGLRSRGNQEAEVQNAAAVCVCVCVRVRVLGKPLKQSGQPAGKAGRISVGYVG